MDVAKELGGLETSKIEYNSYQGMCPTGHDSKGKNCFSINDDLYHCFNCGIGGDLISYVQDVEFRNKSSESFSQSLEWLIDFTGIPTPLDIKGIIAISAQERKENEMANEVLDAATIIFHENLNEEHKEFLTRQYGLTENTFIKHRLGFSRGNTLQELKKKGFSVQECLLSGLFLRSKCGKIIDFFEGRFIFPYMKNNKAMYAIARKSKWTAQNKFEESKYKKLLTRNNKRLYVAQGIKNNTLLNSDSVYRSEYIVVTEGVTDCLVLDQYNFPAVSPATVNFSKNDFKMFSSLIPKYKKIFICNDNEVNQSGEKGALSIAKSLTLNGYTVNIITIPLLQEHIDARKQLEKIS